ncbi:MAG: tetratricopeptide repeat protein [Bacteroidetes bacterium]|nr:tetratricopeptide repeat protein [Bacteroidota bacterium]
MTTTRMFRTGMAALLLIGVAIVIFYRNTPKPVTSGAPPVFDTPATSQTPSKENVHASYTEQVGQLKRSVEKDPKNTAHLIALGQFLMDGHQDRDAIIYFERAAVLEPQNDSLLLDLAVCYANDGRPDQAMVVTERLLTKDRRNVRALYNKGALLASAGKKSDAAAVWKELLRIAPESDEAHTVRGYLTSLEKQ